MKTVMPENKKAGQDAFASITSHLSQGIIPPGASVRKL
jgi:hypothetical protein